MLSHRLKVYLFLSMECKFRYNWVLFRSNLAGRQRWNNVISTLIQRHWQINAIATLFQHCVHTVQFKVPGFSLRSVMTLALISLTNITNVARWHRDVMYLDCGFVIPKIGYTPIPWWNKSMPFYNFFWITPSAPSWVIHPTSCMHNKHTIYTNTDQL